MELKHIGVVTGKSQRKGGNKWRKKGPSRNSRAYFCVANLKIFPGAAPPAPALAMRHAQPSGGSATAFLINQRKRKWANILPKTWARKSSLLIFDTLKSKLGRLIGFAPYLRWADLLPLKKFSISFGIAPILFENFKNYIYSLFFV